jgi:hypothetical protein
LRDGFSAFLSIVWLEVCLASDRKKSFDYLKLVVDGNQKLCDSLNMETKNLQTLAKEYAAGIRGHYTKNRPAVMDIEVAVGYAVEAWLTEIRVWGGNSIEYAEDDLNYWKEKWSKA